MGKQYRVKCYDMDSSGHGLVKFNGSIFAVSRLLPGEKAVIELVYTKGGTFAKLIKIEEPSSMRISPDCPYYSSCGGCQLMHLPYEEQLKWKQKQVTELFQDYLKQISEQKSLFPGLESPKQACPGLIPILGMDNPRFYRCKIHVTFSEDKKHQIISGFYEEHTHKVLPVTSCLIQDPVATGITKDLCKLMKKYRIRPYQEDTGRGSLRHALFRKGRFTGELMLVLVCGSQELPSRKEFTSELLRLHPEINTLVLNYNPKKTSMVLGRRETVLFGKGYIEDKLCGLTFRISPRSFYQVNPIQAEHLYTIAISALTLKGTETVLDAYCGTGTLSLLASRQAKRVIGVELNEDAVKDAIANAKQNQIENVRFLCADAGKYLSRTASGKDHLDAVILDPPRSGCSSSFLQSLTTAFPEKIVYVSCNPQTLKRDVDFLTASGYEMQGIWAVDMFGETWHVETIVLLSHKSPDSTINVKVEF